MKISIKSSKVLGKKILSSINVLVCVVTSEVFPCEKILGVPFQLISLSFRTHRDVSHHISHALRSSLHSNFMLLLWLSASSTYPTFSFHLKEHLFLLATRLKIHSYLSIIFPSLFSYQAPLAKSCCVLCCISAGNGFFLPLETYPNLCSAWAAPCCSSCQRLFFTLPVLLSPPMSTSKILTLNTFFGTRSPIFFLITIHDTPH